MSLFRTTVVESNVQTIPYTVTAPEGGSMHLESESGVALDTQTLLAERTDASQRVRTITGSGPAVDSPTGAAMALGFGLAAVGIAIGILIYQATDEVAFELVQGISIFAVFYILAQAVERLLEPLSAWADVVNPSDAAAGIVKRKSDAETRRDAAVAAAHRDNSMADKAAIKQAAVDQIRKNRTIVMWGAATLMAAIGAGLLHLSLMSAIGFTGLNTGVDLAITALAVGGGTKPLHDLIARIEKSKENKEDPAETESS